MPRENKEGKALSQCLHKDGPWRYVTGLDWHTVEKLLFAKAKPSPRKTRKASNTNVLEPHTFLRAEARKTWLKRMVTQLKANIFKDWSGTDEQVPAVVEKLEELQGVTRDHTWTFIRKQRANDGTWTMKLQERPTPSNDYLNIYM